MLQETLSLDGLLDKFLRPFVVNEREIPEQIMKNIIAICNVVFTKRQSISQTYIDERLLKVQEYKKQLDQLMELPLVKQKSQEWYDMRKGIITASDFAQALGDGKFGTQRDFYMKKSGYVQEAFDPYSPPLKWGNMFEDVACGIYKKRMQCEVHEFGLLKHPTIPFFGASPDGITDLGVMLEIKCPLKREIKPNAECPLQYYYQIQGQLDVCGLQECDYLECKFEEYYDKDLFYEDTETPFEKGVIIEYRIPGQDTPSYEYSPIANASDHNVLKEWEQSHANDLNVDSVHYWKLSILNILRIYKNDEFMDDKMILLAQVWEKVKEYRTCKDLYDKEIGEKKRRAPRVAKYSFIDEPAKE